MDELAFLETFVGIPSLSGQEAVAAAFLVDQMRAFGWESFVDEAGNAVGLLGEAGPLVVLLGHIDTVPGTIPVRVENGRLYGRGAVDAKGPFATFVQAARRVELAGRLRCRLALIGATEEEAASSKGAHYARDRYAPAVCVIGEPSGWDRVTLGYKGRLVAHYRLEQPAAHSAGELRAAPEAMVVFWRAIETYCATRNGERERVTEQLTPSLRHVASGGDGLTDWCEATVGLRLPEGVDPTALAEELRLLAGPATVRFEGGCPAFRSPRTTPLASAFVRAIRAHGGQPAFLHKTGTADMNVVGPAWGCPTVAYGPGDSRLDHTPDEHLEVEEYRRAIAVLADVLASHMKLPIAAQRCAQPVVDDLVAALLSLPQRGRPGQIYNLADDAPAPPAADNDTRRRPCPGLAHARPQPSAWATCPTARGSGGHGRRLAPYAQHPHAGRASCHPALPIVS